MGMLCPLTHKMCPHIQCDPPYDCIYREAETWAGGRQVTEWKPYYVWFPRYLGGNWIWRRWIFRRRAWNQSDKWWEYSFFPLSGTPIYSKYSGVGNGRERDLV
jgi:hypothetical protein